MPERGAVAFEDVGFSTSFVRCLCGFMVNVGEREQGLADGVAFFAFNILERSYHTSGIPVALKHHAIDLGALEGLETILGMSVGSNPTQKQPYIRYQDHCHPQHEESLLLS